MFLIWALEARLCFSDQGRVQSSTIRGGGFGGNVKVKMSLLGWKKKHSSYSKELKILITKNKSINQSIMTSQFSDSIQIPNRDFFTQKELK